MAGSELTNTILPPPGGTELTKQTGPVLTDGTIQAL
jgi:hypothetical protein